jgi:predicted ATP-dependent serine protease
MICSRCGYETDSEVLTCPQCGEVQEEEVEEAFPKKPLDSRPRKQYIASHEEECSQRSESLVLGFIC